jgi:hypothetical protein
VEAELRSDVAHGAFGNLDGVDASAGITVRRLDAGASRNGRQEHGEHNRNDDTHELAHPHLHVIPQFCTEAMDRPGSGSSVARRPDDATPPSRNTAL